MFHFPVNQISNVSGPRTENIMRHVCTAPDRAGPGDLLGYVQTLSCQEVLDFEPITTFILAGENGHVVYKPYGTLTSPMQAKAAHLAMTAQEESLAHIARRARKNQHRAATRKSNRSLDPRSELRGLRL